MTDDHRPRNQKSEPSAPFLTRYLKKCFGFFPPSLVVKAYNFFGKFPPFLFLANAFIRAVTPRQIKIASGVLELDRSDVAVSGSLAFGVFENTEIEMFGNAVKEGATVVDIGAHIGYYTVIAGKKAGGSGRVISYEPEEKNNAFLKRNVQLNGLDNVTILKIGIADKTGRRTFYLNENNKGHHSLSNDSRSTLSTTIETDTLDDSLSKLGYFKIDVIKMDIEGAEALALEGMRKTLARNPDIVLFTEFYPKAIERLGKKPIEFLENLTSMDFLLFAIDEDRKQLRAIGDIYGFAKNFPRGESLINLYAVRKTQKKSALLIQSRGLPSSRLPQAPS